MYAPTQVHWHRSLDEVPDDLPTIYIAHEFLDALPVHQFQKTERGWCERLVDIASDDSPLHFRLVLAPGPTPASELLVDRRLDALPFDQSEPTMQLLMTAARKFAGGFCRGYMYRSLAMHNLQDCCCDSGLCLHPVVQGGSASQWCCSMHL